MVIYNHNLTIIGYFQLCLERPNLTEIFFSPKEEIIDLDLFQEDQSKIVEMLKISFKSIFRIVFESRRIVSEVPTKSDDRSLLTMIVQFCPGSSAL